MYYNDSTFDEYNFRILILLFRSCVLLSVRVGLLCYYVQFTVYQNNIGLHLSSTFLGWKEYRGTKVKRLTVSNKWEWPQKAQTSLVL